MVDLEPHWDCGRDAVRVYDGVNQYYRLLATICNNNRSVVFSTGRSMYIVFSTDGQNVRSGFQATYTATMIPWFDKVPIRQLWYYREPTTPGPSIPKPDRKGRCTVNVDSFALYIFSRIS